MTFRPLALLSLSLSLLVFTGCGGDDDDDGSTGGTSGTSGQSGAGGGSGGQGGAGQSGAGGAAGGNAGTGAGTAGASAGAAGTAGTSAGEAGMSGGSGQSGASGAAGGTSGPPTTCLDAHGSTGCCSADGKTSYFWDFNGFGSKACKGDEVCTWSADSAFYLCAPGPAAADPSGAFPLTCGPGLSTDVTGCKPVDPNAPTTCGGAHGGTGCCSADGKTAYYWYEGEVAANACDEDEVCTWFAEDHVYDCGVAPAVTDPDGIFPLTCTGTVSQADTGCTTACTTAADCAASPATPLCDTASKVCVGCLAASDCKDTSKPFCYEPATTCVGCLTSADCKDAAKPICDAATLACKAGCLASADCKDTTKPICDTGSNTCLACLSDFDCKDASKPSCSAGSCVASSACTGADLAEDADDGPLGATDITPTTGNTTTVTGHSICGAPATESDYFRFTASDGDTVTLTLDWTDTKQDLDIRVVDATGKTFGLDYHARPSVVTLGYLPKGTYFVKITRYDAKPAAESTPYTLGFSRTVGNKCTSLADCAKDAGNSLLRGSCTAAGTCEFIDGQGKLPKDGVCDSGNDCSSGICAATPFNTDASRFAFCSVSCSGDAACGTGKICTTAFDKNFCTVKCTKDSECPAPDLDSVPAAGKTWDYMKCNVATGQCQ